MKNKLIIQNKIKLIFFSIRPLERKKNNINNKKTYLQILILIVKKIFLVIFKNKSKIIKQFI